MNWTKPRGRLGESFWLVPAACVLVAGGAALALVRIDEDLDRSDSAFAFTGGPNSARELLSTIASSMLTLTGLVFSITIVVLRLTSSQFSPRVLRNFLRDRRNQLALGVFLATFVYALVVLREVRGDDASVDEFVPGVAISGAFFLVVASVAMFVQYVHHISQSIRAATIVEGITRETAEAIDRLYPPGREPAAADDGSWREVPVRKVLASPRRGVLVAVDEDDLVHRAERAGATLVLVLAVGDFVPEGEPLVEVRGGPVDADEVTKALTFGRERTTRQDPAFGFRQLVDIAERALSTGVNDPTTAVQCLDHLHDLLRRLGGRAFPSGVRRDEAGVARVVLVRRSWASYVGLAANEIRHWGASSLQVHRRLRALLEDLLRTVGPERRGPVLEQLRLLDARLEDLPASERGPARAGADAGADGRGWAPGRGTERRSCRPGPQPPTVTRPRRARRRPATLAGWPTCEPQPSRRGRVRLTTRRGPSSCTNPTDRWRATAASLRPQPAAAHSATATRPTPRRHRSRSRRG